MIREIFTKKTVIACFIVLPAIFLAAGDGISEETYGYEERDKLAEQAGFVEKLKKDKKKVDLVIKTTKTLIGRSRNKPYLPEIYLRLAELYIEKSRIAYFIHHSEGPVSEGSLSQLESHSLKNKALEVYQRILDNFPDFSGRDKVHFFMAHEYRELGQIDAMVKQYQTIINAHKDSIYVPEAYLLLGDYFVNQTDVELAERHYKAVLNYPQSPAVSIARYKLAWILINKTDYKKAIELLEESIASARSKKLDIDTYRRVDIKLESLVDMAYCYPEAFKNKRPQDALAYFQKFAWSRQVYTIALEKLAYRYFIKKKYRHAIVVYRQLSELRQDSEKLLEYARNIFESVKSLGTFENADQDMAYIVKALKRQKYSVHVPRKEKEKNLTDYELYARNIVTHLHDKARKAKSVPDFGRAADSYKLYLDFFDESSVRAEMERNYAETLFSSKQYIEAGKKYEEMASGIAQNDKQKDELLYGAVISYYNALKEKQHLNYYQVAFARGGLKTAGKLYVANFPKSNRVPDVLFNVAWIKYDEGRYDEAIAEFINFIDRYPKGKAAKAAIHLTLDAFHLKEDYKGLINFGKNIVSNSEITDSLLKAEVSKIVSASESKIVSSITITAMDNWEEGRSNLIALVEQNKSSSLGKQALDALIVSSKERGDLEALFSAGRKLILQDHSLSNIEDTLGVMIESSLRISQFRILAEYLEEFARRFPKQKNSKEFLFQAAQIRKSLGQYALSNKNYQQIFDHSQKAGDLEEGIVFDMADNFERMGHIDSAINVLKKNSPYLSKVGRIKADTLVSNLSFKVGNLKETLEYRKRAYKAFRRVMGKKDPSLNSLIAQMVYNAFENKYKKYMKMQLRDHIDNKVVAAKSKLFGKLEKAYLEVISYQSPEWALEACYRAYEVNKEFARFLKEAPLPKLTPEQEKQYFKIVNKKAQKYVEKANEYLKTSIELVHKWEIVDPKLTKYSNGSAGLEEVSFFSGTGPLVKIEEDFLKDEKLKNLHGDLMKSPNDMKTLLSLSKVYLERGDYLHPILIAQKAIDEIKIKKDPLKARFHNTIAVSQLYNMKDTAAKNSLRRALKIDPRNIGARINLAGLYQHYGHKTKAEKMYRSLPNSGLVENSTDLIHPKAMELYYAYINGAKK